MIDENLILDSISRMIEMQTDIVVKQALRDVEYEVWRIAKERGSKRN